MTQIEFDCLSLLTVPNQRDGNLRSSVIWPAVIRAHTPLYTDYDMPIRLYLISNSNDESNCKQ